MVTTNILMIERQKGLFEDIGRVTVHWSAVDLCLLNIAAIALRNEESANDLIMRSGNAGRQRIEAFERSVGGSHFDQGHRQRLLSLTDRLLKLLPARNDIIHSPLVVNYKVNGRKLLKSLAKVTKSGKMADVSREDIVEHVRLVGIILAELEEITYELEDNYPIL